jgi:hypothetical protein
VQKRRPLSIEIGSPPVVQEGGFTTAYENRYTA